MSTATVLAVVALLAIVVLLVRLAALRRRVHRLESRLHSVESKLATEVGPTLRAAREDAKQAAATARRVASATGVEEPGPRVALEPVAGPIVRAVAIGAGARRALSRLVRPGRPRA